MGDPSAPPQSDKNAQPAKKRMNRQTGDSSAPQHVENNTQPAKKRVNRQIGDQSAPQQSEKNAQPAKKKNMQPANKRVNRVIGNSSAPPQSEMNAQPTENGVNTLVSSSCPPQTEKITQPTKKRVRGATRMAHFLLKRLNGEKIPIDFDQWTKKPLGENRKKFKSHVGSIARSKVSILVDHWDLVSEDVKNKIWEDIMEQWDIPDTHDIPKLKDKWLSYAGERWRAFKTNLTRRYLNSKQIESMKADLTKEIRDQVMRDLSSIPAFSQHFPNFPTCSPSTDIPASTKGSCSAAPPIPEDDDEDIPEECELYVDNKQHIVAYANVYKLGPTIHNKLLENGMVRVAVTKVLDSNAQVPMPTDEVTKVGDALNTFIQWPKRLLRLVSNKDVKETAKDDLPSKRSEPEKSCIEKLMLRVLNLKHPVKFDLNENEFFYLPTRDIMELCLKTEDLCLTILRIWVVYMERLCTQLGNSDVYGFVDPFFIHAENDEESSQSHMTAKMFELNKACYFAPYLKNRHWQLLIIEPEKQNVVFLCSMGWKPDKNLVQIVNSAIEGYNKLSGVRKARKPTWEIPKCQRQPFNYECGYFIMIHMLNIVSAGITDSWDMIFGDETPFSDDEMTKVQERCASLILERLDVI